MLIKPDRLKILMINKPYPKNKKDKGKAKKCLKEKMNKRQEKKYFLL